MSTATETIANILVVDDDPANQLAIEATLHGLGANLIRAHSGEEALRLLLATEFAAVLLDIQMPGLNGFETAKLIRQRDRSKGIPIIFVTAYDNDPKFSVRNAYSLGAVDYLVKPLLPEVLRSKIAMFIELFRRTKAAAQAELDAREQLARVLANVSDLFFMFDQNLRCTYANDRAAQMSEIPRERLIGKSLNEIFPEISESELRHAITQERPLHFESHQTLDDRWFDHRAYPSGDGLMLVSTEITDRKQGEAQLRESEARFRLTADHAPVLIWLSGADKSYTWFNKPWLDFTGRALEQELGSGWTEGVHPDDLPHYLDVYTKHFDARTPFKMEYRLRHHSGMYRWVADKGIAVHGSDGEFMGYIGSCIDIHDRKLGEEQLTLLVDASASLSASLDLESVLSAVLELSSKLIAAHAYAVWLYDSGLRRWGIAHSSGLSELFCKATCEELDQIPPMPERPIIAEEVLGVPLLGGREIEYSAEGIRSLLAAPLKVRDRTAGMLVFYYRSTHRFTDVEVRVATALANLSASAIGTAELYGVLRTHSRRKDEFLAMLAHELRNPLSAISNAVQLARMSIEDEVREWSRKVIERQVRHLSRLMDDLLDVSRITRGKIVLKKELLDAVPLLETAVDSLRPLMEERKHSLHVSLPSDSLWVKADPTRLEQIVTNLLTNAAKYTDEGGQVSLAARREGDRMVLVVADSGVGISPDVLPEMFDLFAQGNRTLARSEGGLGIGLTLVKSLTEMHGGTVSAQSDGHGKGSEFTVTLPVSAGRTEAHPRASMTKCPSVGELMCRRILIVDDHKDTAMSLSRLLRLAGHEVMTADDGYTALEVARRFRPDCVLLDIGLPGMTGYELAKRLRLEKPFQKIFIVAISGYGQHDDRLLSKEAGMEVHFMKPVDHEALLKLITSRA